MSWVVSGGQELPPTTERRGELRDHHRERPELARAKECQRDEQVVPNAEEYEDHQGRDRRQRHRNSDAQKANRVAGAIDLSRLEDLTRQTAQVVPKQEDLKWQAEACVGKPDRHDRAVEVENLEERQQRHQRHLDRNDHQAHNHNEEDVLARKFHPGERVSAHGCDRQLDDSRRDCDEDAGDDRRLNALDVQNLLIASEREAVGRKQSGPPSG